MSNILIADSGSTKTHWAILENNSVNYVETEGINPLFSTKNDVEKLLKILKNIPYDAIYFYGAGYVDTEKCNNLKNIFTDLLNVKTIEVHTDLLGAARALCGNSPAIACILGTGANSCYFDGQAIVQNVPPLGFILGDEGSGANIGKNLLANCLKGLTSNDLKIKLLDYLHLTYPEIIDHVYRQPFPNRFLAQISKFASQNIDNQEVKAVVEASFNTFVERNLKLYGNPDLPVNFVGSVAFAFKDLLTQVLENQGFKIGKIIKEPIEELVKYHSGILTK